MHILKSYIKIYELNEFLSLRLERGRTSLYVNGKRFHQCMQLVLNVPKANPGLFEGVESIDEIVDIIEEQGGNRFRREPIPEEEEFWGHCSNLQAWISHDYDTRVLHRSFAFPLLRELTKLGDPKAKKVYKDEIVYRFKHGNFNIITFLLEQGYLKALTHEELEVLFSDFDFDRIIHEKIDILFPTLTKLGELGSPILKQILKNQVEKIFAEGNIQDIQYIIRGDYLKQFTEGEIDRILKKFDFNFLSKEDARISLPLFKSLADTGNQRAKQRFSSEIKERIDSGLEADISFLVDNHYFTPYSQDELNEIFSRINFDNIINAATYRSLSLLKKISELGSVKAKQILKEKIKTSFLSDNYNDPITVVQGKYLESFSKEESENLFNQLDFSIFPNDELGRKVIFLKSLIDDGISGARDQLIKDAISSFSSPNPNLKKLEDIFFKSYNKPIDLQILFTQEELEDIFQRVDYHHLNYKIVKYLTDLRLSKPLKVLRKRFAENKDKQEILKRYIKIIQDDLEKGNFKEFYHWFKKYYKPWERYPRFSDPLTVTQPPSRENLYYYSFGILQDDFEKIFKYLTDSTTFKANFRKALTGEKYPFSIPFKTIAYFAENDILEAQKFFRNEAEHVFKDGSLRFIGFLSRPQYIKFLNNNAIKRLFSFSNEHVKSLLMDSLLKVDLVPLALIILKRMTFKGDMKAFMLLKQKIKLLIASGSVGMKQFLKKDGFSEFFDIFSSDERISIIKVILSQESVTLMHLIDTTHLTQEIIEVHLKYLQDAKLIFAQWSNKIRIYKINQENFKKRGYLDIIQIV